MIWQGNIWTEWDIKLLARLIQAYLLIIYNMLKKLKIIYDWTKNIYKRHYISIISLACGGV